MVSMPGPKQPPRLHGEGCICGDHERYECPVKHRRPPSKDLYAPENVVAFLRSNASQSIAGKQYAHAADEIERLRGRLEAAEQHVKILQEQRAGLETGLTHSCHCPAKPGEACPLSPEDCGNRARANAVACPTCIPLNR